jgi:hypothetical protein
MFQHYQDGLVQLGLMWWHFELGLGMDSDRHTKP